MTGSSVIPSRRWKLLVEVDEDALIPVCVAVDDRVLQPMLRCDTPADAMAHAEAVLLDWRHGDSIEGVVRSSTTELSCAVMSKCIALAWLAPTLVEAWHAAKVFHAADAWTGARTGVRPIANASAANENPKAAAAFSTNSTD